MTKNIILCADGTGNKGGYTPDSNVYKIYNAIDIHDPDLEQIVFYDNGVGTQTNKIIRSLSGALGFGFKQNVCDLYEYLARQYDPGDKIYMFGFSRGAATIRAFNGFVDACGLIDGRGKGNRVLKEEVETAIEAYEKAPHLRKEMLADVKMHEVLPEIQFIGVWDTVSALGFPERTDKPGIFLKLLDLGFKIVARISDTIWPYKFYNYELTANVKNAFHALAIDDARTSFWPKVWNEATAEARDVNVEQVWFAGMHSNIGGGYERAGLANVSFSWMLAKVDGLKLKSGVIEAAGANANVNGRMYDSRQGLASFYRFHPRELEMLCQEAGAAVKIHQSVMRRLKLRTANYAPLLLPQKFEEVDDAGIVTASPEIYQTHWQQFREGINACIKTRKWLYGIMLELTLALVGLAYYFWSNPVKTDMNGVSAFQTTIIDICEIVTPQFFDELIKYSVVQNPWCGFAILATIGVFLFGRTKAKNKTTDYAERLRKLVIIAPNQYPE